MTMRGMGSRRGFTLLELLLALAVTVIVATLLASSLYTAFRARDSIERSVESAQFAASFAAGLMAEEIPLALPPTPSSNTSTNLMFGLPMPGLGATTQSLLGAFVGDEQSLIFCVSGSEPKAEVQADVREVQYLLVTDSGSTPAGAMQNLVRRVRTNLLADNTETPPDEIIARNVQKLGFRYFDGVVWGDTWDSTLLNHRLPVAVEVTLELAPARAGELTRVEVRTVSLPCATEAPEEESGLGGFLR